MNYFAHGRHYIERPYFLAGTAVPDWLNVVDRRVRVRPKHLASLLTDPSSASAPNPSLTAEQIELARGIAQHHADDAWFHESQAFVELSLRFTVMIRDHLPPDEGLRPSFLGHILVEILLDAALTADNPGQLKDYYRAVEQLDPSRVEAAVNRLAPRPCERLAWFVTAFVRERFLWDYLDNDRLWYRLNQVMRRVGLAPLDVAFCELLPEMRSLVDARRVELLAMPGELPTVASNHIALPNLAAPGRATASQT